MKRETAILLIILCMLLASCTADRDISNLVQVGQTRKEIKSILGEPDEIKTFTKSAGPIWGPEEEFWDKIPAGSKLEVWRYQGPNGNLNLYFLDDAERLSYKAYAPKGVVYEPTK